MLETNHSAQQKIDLFQFPFESHYLTLEDGNKLHYIDEGEGDKIILCVHGNPTWSYYYRHIINNFKGDFRVIAPDHLGMGFSSKPEQYNFSLENRVKHLTFLIDKLNLKNIYLIVHDWGGPIGLGALLERPNLFQKLVLSNTAGFHLPKMPKRIALGRIPFLGKYLIQNKNLFASMATKYCVSKPMPNKIKNGYLAPYSTVEDRRAIYDFVQDIPMSSSHPSYDYLKMIESNLKNIQIPKILLWGGKDFCFNDLFFYHWLKVYPEIKTHYFENVGHYLFEDNSQDINKILDSFFNHEVQ